MSLKRGPEQVILPLDVRGNILRLNSTGFVSPNCCHFIWLCLETKSVCWLQRALPTWPPNPAIDVSLLTLAPSRSPTSAAPSSPHKHHGSVQSQRYQDLPPLPGVAFPPSACRADVCSHLQVSFETTSQVPPLLYLLL